MNETNQLSASASPSGAPTSGAAAPAQAVKATREPWRLLCAVGGVLLVLVAVAAMEIWPTPLFPDTTPRFTFFDPIERGTALYPSSQAPGFEDVTFLDPMHGWGVTFEGLYATDDGGRGWSRRPEGEYLEWHQVRFLDANFGWIAAGSADQHDQTGYVRITENGGKTWTEYSLGEATTIVYDAVFVDRRRGWATTKHGQLFTTTDGGLNWRPQTVESPRAPSPAAQTVKSDGIPFGARARVAFANPQVGWFASATGELFWTRNGGASWRPVQLKEDRVQYNALAARDDKHAMAVGQNGVLLMTVDGDRWERRNAGVPSAVGLNAVAFLDDAHLIAVGDNGTIVVSANGGQTWSPRNSGVQAELSSVSFIDPLHGWVAGANGTLLATTDGGQTWLQPPPNYRVWPPPFLWLGLGVGLMALGAAAFVPTKEPAPVDSIEELFLSDSPLSPGNAPRWMRHYTKGLANYLANPKTAAPITLAISAPWGRGKSSVMELMRAELEETGHRPVVFNAWHHQDTTNVLAALLGAIREQAIPPLVSFPNRLPPISFAGVAYYARLAAQRAKRQWLLVLVLHGLVALAVTWLVKNWSWVTSHLPALWSDKAPESGAGKPDAPEDLTDWLGPLKGIGALLLGIAPVAKLLLLLRAFHIDPAKLLIPTAGTTKEKNLTELNVFRTRFAVEFDEVTQALGPDHRMVIFIDDLDRCVPTHLLQVLEATNFLNSSGECFVVLGMQRESVLLCLKEALSEGQLGPSGGPERWLEKLVQIEVGVPRDDEILQSLVPKPPSKVTDEPAEKKRDWRSTLLLPLTALRGLMGRIHLYLKKSKPPSDAIKPKPTLKEIEAAEAARAKRIKWVRYAALAPLALAGLAGALWLGYSGGQQWHPPAESPPPKGIEISVDLPAALAGGAATDKKDWHLTGHYIPGAALTLAVDNAAPTTTGGSGNGTTRNAGQTPPPPPSSPSGPVRTNLHTLEPTNHSSITALVVAGAFAAVILLIVALNRQLERRVRDSLEFYQAINDWKPVLTKHCDTPRELKRMLNRMRFDAMLVRALDADESVDQDKVSEREGHVVTIAVLEKVWPSVFSSPGTPMLDIAAPAKLAPLMTQTLRNRLTDALGVYRSREFATFKKFKDSIRLDVPAAEPPAGAKP